jgi:transcriptional regulator with PAS, ATPase and Fis domain
MGRFVPWARPRKRRSTSASSPPPIATCTRPRRIGSFRADLLYRLDVLSISMPSLRERREDLAELIAHFFKQSREKYANALPEKLSREALDCLLAYAWPGNVRELGHVLEKVVLLGRSSVVSLEDLPDNVRHPDRPATSSFKGTSCRSGICSVATPPGL